MTTTPASPASAPDASPAPHDHEASRGTTGLASWRASWRLALRMARREVRHHRGASTLIALMALLPVAIVVGGLVVSSTQRVSSTEELDLALGGSEAMVTLDPEQAPQPTVPGWAPGREAGAIRSLIGAEVAQVTSSSARTPGADPAHVSVLGADPASHAFLEGRTHLLGGRWPTRAGEAVVTRVGTAHGLPTSGTLTVLPLVAEPPPDSASDGAGAPVTLTVVGTATAFTSTDLADVQPADLVTLPGALGQVQPALRGERQFSGPLSSHYLVARREPLTPTDVSTLHDHGLRLVDRGLAQPAATASDLDPTTVPAWTTVATVLLLLLSGLLAGPAFAVSAARQRPTLAVAAANGATAAQLRRTMLGQALLLGGPAALVGGAIALGVSWLVLTRLAVTDPTTWWGPYDVPIPLVAGVVAAAVTSTLVAALLPARGLGHLDVARELAGGVVSSRPRRGARVVGTLLVVGGTILVVAAFAVAGSGPEIPNAFAVIGGGVAMAIGTMSLVPSILDRVGRSPERLGLSARLATREAARQRRRTTPTVAVVLVATAVLTTVLVVTASLAPQGEDADGSTTPAGTAFLRPAGMDRNIDPDGRIATDTLGKIARAVAPQLTVSTTAQLAGDVGPDALGRPASRAIAALRHGCPVVVITAETDLSPRAPDPSTVARCTSLNTASTAPGRQVLVADADYLALGLGLDASERTSLDRGALLVASGPGPTDERITGRELPSAPVVEVVDGAVTMVDARLATEPVGVDRVGAGTLEGQILGKPTIVRVPALTLDRSRFLSLGAPGAVMARSAATAHGWPALYEETVAWDPAGPISQEVQDSVQAALDVQQPGSTIEVERGAEPMPALRAVTWVAMALAALLTLVATLIASALTQAESRAFSGTLAAIGATLRSRRLVAGTQAAYLAAVGGLLGIAVGLLPGVLIARLVTGALQGLSGVTPAPVVVVPWLELLVPAVVVPVGAGLVAAAFVRSTPTVTHRLT